VRELTYATRKTGYPDALDKEGTVKEEDEV